MRNVLILVLIGWAASAQAHPVALIVQTAYLTLAPGAVQLELDMTPGNMVVDVVLAGLDPDGDQIITDAEARAFGEAVLAEAALTVDGTAAGWVLADVRVPPYGTFADTTGIISIHATALRADTRGAHVLHFQNGYLPTISQMTANVFLQPGDGLRYKVTGQTRSDDGAGLAVMHDVVIP